MSEEPLKFKEKFLFGISAIPDQLTYQVFQFLVFTYYFTVVRLPLGLIMAGYIILFVIINKKWYSGEQK